MQSADPQRLAALEVSIEIHLARIGLLRVLEALNVIPVVSDPNPYDPETSFLAYDIWWQRRPKEAVAYYKSQSERQAALFAVNETLRTIHTTF